MLKSFYLPRSYNSEKGQGAVDDLNNLLNEIGVSFTVSKNNNGQKLCISVDEEKLHSITENRSGRPVAHEFDIEKIQQMKKEGWTNKKIYEKLGMSKALFYLRMREYQMKNE